MRQRVVILTRQTAKQVFVQRYGSEGQTKFAMAQSLRGRADFAKAEVEDSAQSRAVARIRQALPSEVKLAEIDRGMVAQFLFEPHDLVVAVGQDGLVANVGKYLDGQPIAGVNPDPETIEGALLPFNVDTFVASLSDVLGDRRGVRFSHADRPSMQHAGHGAGRLQIRRLCAARRALVAAGRPDRRLRADDVPAPFRRHPDRARGRPAR